MTENSTEIISEIQKLILLALNPIKLVKNLT